MTPFSDPNRPSMPWPRRLPRAGVALALGALVLGALVLSACGERGGSAEERATAGGKAPAVATDTAVGRAGPPPAHAVPIDTAAATGAPAAGEPSDSTIGGDGSAIRLSPLTGADVEGARLAGELACSFGPRDAPPLLLARGDVASAERAYGVIKVLDSVEGVSARGGFDGIVDGATFVGRGTTIRIALTGAPIGGGESPPRPATLTYDRADGARRTFRGLWSCGP